KRLRFGHLSSGVHFWNFYRENGTQHGRAISSCSDVSIRPIQILAHYQPSITQTDYNIVFHCHVTQPFRTRAPRPLLRPDSFARALSRLSRADLWSGDDRRASATRLPSQSWNDVSAIARTGAEGIAEIASDHLRPQS